jgi:hypothetical protein
MKNFIQILLTALFGICIVLGTNAQSEIEDHFPVVNVLEFNDPAPGYIFIGSKTKPDTTSFFIAAIDNYGTPVFFRKTEAITPGAKINHDGTISYVMGAPRKLYISDSMLEITDTFTTVGYKINAHDWDIDENGNVVLMGKAFRTVDLSGVFVGGHTAAVVEDLIIQEFDSEKNLLYTWNSANHFEITDFSDNTTFVDSTSDDIDYVHANAVTFDSDTSILISSRHMDEITKIDRRTGDIIWRLGGENNQFTFINDTIGFSHQHSIRRLENGHIILFDNGNTHDVQNTTGVEYELDEVNMTATLIQRFERNPTIYAWKGGSIEGVSNGNTLVGWNQWYPTLTEFKPDGSVALELDYSDHSWGNKIGKHIWQIPHFEADVQELNFGLWSGSQADELIVTVTNLTDSTFSINNTHNHSDVFSVTTGLPVDLLPLSTVDITVSFDPSASAGSSFEDVLTICNDEADQRLAVQVKLFGEKASSNIHLSSEYEIYPNPSKDVINIKGLNEPVNIRIMSLTGQLIHEQKSEDNTVSLNLKDLKKGLYIIQITNLTDNTIYTQKVIKE